MVMDEYKGLPIVSASSQEAWSAWLEENQAAFTAVWLKIAKKGSGFSNVSYLEAVETALCYGWIDGQAASLDEAYYLQRFTPRRKGSKWSKINRDKAEELIAQGRMQPAGLLEVERARADGRWEAAYDGQRTITVPEDFQQALDQNQVAQEFFATLNSQNRYAILYRIQDAKKPETRARRIATFIGQLSEHKKIYP
jgi:uncharacterized protein YdeI (YjbR/CyaY-like superfamily)